jgi:hypothetical protein
MPFDVSDERNLLASMIAERDAQISSLTHQLHSTSDALRDVQRELSNKTSARRKQREEHSETIKRLKDEHAECRRVLGKYEQSVRGGGGLRVHEYAALMKTANSTRVESSYVLRLQAQLCGAMHGLGVMESQLALVKDNCSGLIRSMKEDLSHMVDDRTRREIELMNGLARVDNEKRVMSIDMEKRIKEREELLDQVREEYEELGLEYDEDEVKSALEVRYLLEQMERVKEDRVRLERELLAALLEREEQVQKLRAETEKLDVRYEELLAEEGGGRMAGGDAAHAQRSGDGSGVGGGTAMGAASSHEEEEDVDGDDVDRDGNNSSGVSNGHERADGKEAVDPNEKKGGGACTEDDVVVGGQADAVVSDVAHRDNPTSVDEDELPGDDEVDVDDNDESSDETNEGDIDDRVAGDAGDPMKVEGAENKEDVSTGEIDFVVAGGTPVLDNSLSIGDDKAPASDAVAAASAPVSDKSDSNGNDDDDVDSEHVDEGQGVTAEEPLDQQGLDASSLEKLKISDAIDDR